AAESPKQMPLAFSAVRDTKAGDIVMKLVNVTGDPIRTQVQLTGAQTVAPNGKCSVLSGDAKATNPGDPRAKNNVSEQPMIPQTSDIPVRTTYPYDVPAHPLTVIRIKMGS